jgi:hypothetical protein
MLRQFTFLFALLMLVSPLVSAQEQQATPPAEPSAQHHHDMPPDQTSQQDMQNMPGMSHDNMQHDQVSEPVRLELDAASGSAWQAQSSPQFMWMTRRGSWDLMLHGQVDFAFNYQGGHRGAGKLESMNWVMGMQQRKLGRGILQFRQMLSAETLTSPHPGYPQIFQTGETYKGQALVDHQHPHDVFGEISARYVLPLSEKVAWFVYGGPSAEPALGPVTFMHRISAMELPAAPRGHHLQDSTHISFGVVTSGFIVGKFKVEGSAFNAREPDEQRWNFDFAPMDSFSGRVTFAPGKNWAMQYSYGHLRKPEALEDGNINRQTASINYNRDFKNGFWASTLVWGRNFKSDHSTVQNSYLAESTLNFKRLNYVYTRLELLDRDELFPNGGSPLGGPHDNYRIGAYTFGAVRDLVQNNLMQIGLGANVTFYSMPTVLNPVYGNRPVSTQVYLLFRPGRMQH